MKMRVALFALAILAATAGHGRAQEGSSREVTLPEMLLYANAHAPALHVEEQRQALGVAAREGADRLLADNPSVSFGIGPRFSGNQNDYDFVAALEQPIEIAGQRGLRKNSAESVALRLKYDLERARLEVRRDVTLAYCDAAASAEEAVIATQLDESARTLRDIAKRRFDQGDIGAIDFRMAEIDAARAHDRQIAAEHTARSTRLRLAVLSGWPLDSPPVPTALQPVDDASRLSAGKATPLHPEVKVSRAKVAEAHAQAEVASREGWPDPTLGIEVGREAQFGSPTNYVVLGTIGFPIPFWNRNQGPRAQARAEEGVATAETESLSAYARARVLDARAAFQAALERARLYDHASPEAFQQDLSLLSRAFAAGEISVRDVAVAQERFLSAQSDALTAKATFHRARAELEYALGAPPPSARAQGEVP